MKILKENIEYRTPNIECRSKRSQGEATSTFGVRCSAVRYSLLIRAEFGKKMKFITVTFITVLMFSLVLSGCGSGKEAKEGVTELETSRKKVQLLQAELKARDAELEEVKTQLETARALTVDEKVKKLRQELAKVKEESASKIKKVRKHLSIAQKACDEKNKQIDALSNELGNRE